MDYKRIEFLLHKYLEGNSTIAEEKELNVFFTTNDEVPEKFLFAKDLFCFFNEEKSNNRAKIIVPRKPKNKSKLYYLTGIAASLLIGMFLLFSNNNAEEKIIYAFVDGKAITDISVAEKLTKEIILSATKNLETGTNSLQYASQFTNPITLIQN
ncbi:MAG: hypothetical protein HN352_04910 [Bacteroidetes bacterium]|jgi:hypothetical protein|nr:hypothetical protein [Bacteroidota bacterium]MBT4970278.1 hypothetical protein [Bacteroidota bacterium]MBT6045952.1 hypothetical protein [Candidatus Scalindua sp.]MBT7466217.1 hypothetical protein [Bacteroidota bacterium]MBT7826196.1 hypothetical protein [Bacteroidota bacterium]